MPAEHHEHLSAKAAPLATRSQAQPFPVTAIITVKMLAVTRKSRAFVEYGKKDQGTPGLSLAPLNL